ncbi:hypothetical protein [Streptomyces sp. NBC_00986]|uniref:hypothetical protein n=1 Tax=Streptomyces sp. NBC_00986 TaxID=2903702 RepID=UPI0038649C88|nr:hypothetical protein OG504_13065 [Streptomyces sp. NBC_00986]
MRFVEGFGADEVIDYTAVDHTEAVRDIDATLDTIAATPSSGRSKYRARVVTW